MNATEVRETIEEFEEGRNSLEQTLRRLHQLTGESVDPELLKNYQAGLDLDEFVSLLIEPPVDWNQLTEEQTLALITEALNVAECSSGRLNRIDEAICRRYSKPQGTLIDLIFHQDLQSPSEILKELNKDTGFHL